MTYKYRFLYSFNWPLSNEGYYFWYKVYNGQFDAARALLAPDYKEMWEAADRLIQHIQKYYNLDDSVHTEVYNHYQQLKSKHNG